MKRPSVVVVARRTTRKDKYIDYVGEYHLALLVRLGIVPVIVPVVDGTLKLLSDYASGYESGCGTGMRGLLLYKGEDVEPRRYKANSENYTHLEKTHPLKDEIELALISRALRQKLPILGICRGAQLLNVAAGGTLYGDVQKTKKSQLKHISEGSRYDSYRHPISIEPQSPLHKWYKRKTLRVNSYHHQGVRDLAPRFVAMAHAGDGLVEGFYDPKAEFVVGLQFHPERLLEEAAGNWRIWQAFGAAVRRKPAR